jgi:hypothetical protein
MVQNIGGNMTDNVTGNKLESITGTLTDTVTGAYTINANATTTEALAVYSKGGILFGATGNMVQNIGGNMTDNVSGTLTDNVTGAYTINANATGTEALAVYSKGGILFGATGNMVQNIGGNMTDNVTGTLTDNVTGAYTINANATGTEALAIYSKGGILFGATGNMVQNIGGNITLGATGNMVQNIGGNITLGATGNMVQNIVGNVTLGATGNMVQNIVGNMTDIVAGAYTINANATGTEALAVYSKGGILFGATGNMVQNIGGNMTDNVTGTLTDSVEGNYTINANSTGASSYNVDSKGGVTIGATGTNGSLTLSSYKGMNLNAIGDLSVALGSPTGMLITSSAAASVANYAMSVYQSGTTGALLALDTLGDLTILGNFASSSVTSTSDERLKKNIEPIESALDKVKSLNGIYFDWIDESKPGRNIGLIAQNVQSVVPELVSSENTYLTVNYSQMVALLIEAIKEQQQQIDELKAKLA